LSANTICSVSVIAASAQGKVAKHSKKIDRNAAKSFIGANVRRMGMMASLDFYKPISIIVTL
jgi:hypothetical protein